MLLCLLWMFVLHRIVEHKPRLEMHNERTESLCLPVGLRWRKQENIWMLTIAVTRVDSWDLFSLGSLTCVEFQQTGKSHSTVSCSLLTFTGRSWLLSILMIQISISAHSVKESISTVWGLNVFHFLCAPTQKPYILKELTTEPLPTVPQPRNQGREKASCMIGVPDEQNWPPVHRYHLYIYVHHIITSYSILRFSLSAGISKNFK